MLTHAETLRVIRLQCTFLWQKVFTVAVEVFWCFLGVLQVCEHRRKDCFAFLNSQVLFWQLKVLFALIRGIVLKHCLIKLIAESVFGMFNVSFLTSTKLSAVALILLVILDLHKNVSFVDGSQNFYTFWPYSTIFVRKYMAKGVVGYQRNTFEVTFSWTSSQKRNHLTEFCRRQTKNWNLTVPAMRIFTDWSMVCMCLQWNFFRRRNVFFIRYGK